MGDGIRGRLMIVFEAADGSASGEKVNHDIVMELSQHGITVDSNGQVHISISGRIGK